MSLPTIDIKAGETFALGCSFTDDDGAAIDLTGYTATCQVRDSDGTQIGALTVAVDAGSGGTFVLSATAATTVTWAVGSYVADIRLVSAGGEVHPSDTFGVRVINRITAGGA